MDDRIHKLPPAGASQPVSDRRAPPGSVSGYRRVGYGTAYNDALDHVQRAREHDAEPEPVPRRRPQQRKPADPAAARIQRLEAELAELRGAPKMPTAKMAQRRQQRQQPTRSKVPERDAHGQLPPWNADRFNFRDVKVEDVELPRNNSASRVGPDRQFTSVDGVTYTFRKASATNRDPGAAAQDMAMVNMLALMEMFKGGDPLRVYEAFRVRVNDVSEPSKNFFDFAKAEEYRINSGVDYEDSYAGIAGTDTTGVPFAYEDGYDGFAEYEPDYEDYDSGFSID